MQDQVSQETTNLAWTEAHLEEAHHFDVPSQRAKAYDKPTFPPRPPNGDGKADRSQKGKGGGKEARAKPYPAKPGEEKHTICKVRAQP